MERRKATDAELAWWREKFERENEARRLARLEARGKPHPGKSAHLKVREAVRLGKLERPDRCNRCDGKAKRSLHAHHEDYSKPLAVEWLCEKCHCRLHTIESTGLAPWVRMFRTARRVRTKTPQ